MKRSNAIFLTIVALNVAGLFLLFWGPDSPEKAKAPTHIQESPALPEVTVPSLSEGEPVQPEPEALLLYDMDLQSLQLINSELDQSKQRNIALQDAFRRQNSGNSLIPGSSPEEKIQMHKRMDELQDRQSQGSLSRQEQIELLQLRIQKKKDHLELQKNVQMLYADQAPLGPAGDYEQAIKEMKNEISSLEEKLRKVENTGHRID
ncbi:MAG: hypothetical protein CMF59_15265 [Leptospiraceae bacterium]|nr:hypothetical protein [Leptospiraceae bacterium]